MKFVLNHQTYHYLILICVICSFIRTANAQDTTRTAEVRTKSVVFSVLPVVAFTPETSLQLGAFGTIVFQKTGKVADQYYRPSSLVPFVIYTLRNQLQTAVEADLFLKGGWNVYAYTRYYLYPDYYFGIGRDTKKEDEEIYNNEFFRINGRIAKAISPKLFVGLAYDLQNDVLYGFKEGKTLEQRNTYGINGGLMAGVGPSIRFDTRDDIFYPSRGWQISWETFFFNFDYQFTLSTIDVRRYLNLSNNDKNVIALQAYAQLSDGQVPFYKLPRLGGSSFMRGIFENRFRNNHALYAQIEYRRRLFWRFSATVFAGAGDVRPMLEELNLEDLRYNYGAGLRFQLLKDEKLNIRFDYGIGSPDQSGIYLSVREAF